MRTAIKAKEHGRSELYLDEHFYNSLQFRFEFNKQARPKYTYSAPMMDVGSHYYCAQLQEVLENISPDKKVKQGDAQES